MAKFVIAKNEGLYHVFVLGSDDEEITCEWFKTKEQAREWIAKLKKITKFTKVEDRTGE